MQYRIFLDTNIYDGANYSFHNAAFETLRAYAGEQKLSLVINSVIEGEVRSHIAGNIKEVVNEWNKVIKDRRFAGLRKLDGFSVLLKKRNPEEWVQACLNEFDSFLEDCHVDRIGVEEISIGNILSDYFNRQPPFEMKKPNEFKDAIAVASLLKDIHKIITELSSDWTSNGDETLYAVISADKGFCKAVVAGLSEKEKENVRVFNSLNVFVDHTVMLDRQAEFLKAYLMSESGRGEIEETVRAAVDTSDLNIVTEAGYFIDDQELQDVSDILCDAFILGVYEEDGIAKMAKVALEVKCHVRIWYQYVDEDNSYWDKEEQRYFWKTEAEVCGTYETGFETIVSLEITDCQVPDDWKPEDNYDFKNEKIGFNDYLEKPQSIDLDDDCLIEEEVEEPWSEH